MRFQSVKEGPIGTLNVAGDSTVEDFHVEMLQQIQQLLDHGEPFVILDLRELTVLDSAGIGTLVACRERIRRHDGIVKLVVEGASRDAIVASGLDRLFEVFQTAGLARASFLAEDETAGIP